MISAVATSVMTYHATYPSVAAGFLLEASTPFVSLRKILAILGTLEAYL